MPTSLSAIGLLGYEHQSANHNETESECHGDKRNALHRPSCDGSQSIVKPLPGCNVKAFVGTLVSLPLDSASGVTDSYRAGGGNGLLQVVHQKLELFFHGP